MQQRDHYYSTNSWIISRSICLNGCHPDVSLTIVKLCQIPVGPQEPEHVVLHLTASREDVCCGTCNKNHLCSRTIYGSNFWEIICPIDRVRDLAKLCVFLWCVYVLDLNVWAWKEAGFIGVVLLDSACALFEFAWEFVENAECETARNSWMYSYLVS